MIFKCAEVLSLIINVPIQSFDEAILKLTPDRRSGTRYFFQEGAPLPYLNGTVRKKYGIVWYFTLNRIDYYTEHYRTLPESTGHVIEQYQAVPDMLPNSIIQYGTDRPNKLG